VTRYIEERRATFGVEPICRMLEVPVSSLYARRSREPSRRELRDRELVAEIHASRAGYRRVYGVRKTWRELRRRGVDLGRDRVARLMRKEGLEGVRRGMKTRTTIPDEAAVERARDLLQRDFSATRPNEKWLCDIIYLRTWQGFVYLAFILDCFSRMIVGWQLATHPRTELVLDALGRANGLRRPSQGLIAHSDRGCQGSTRASPTPAASTSSRSRPRSARRGDAYDYNDERLHEELGDVRPRNTNGTASPTTGASRRPRPARQRSTGTRWPASAVRCRAGKRASKKPRALHAGIPLDIIQRQLGHANPGTTSIYLQGIDPEEIIATVRMRRAPMMSASAAERL
jgi:transposase InsO family protein